MVHTWCATLTGLRTDGLKLNSLLSESAPAYRQAGRTGLTFRFGDARHGARGERRRCRRNMGVLPACGGQALWTPPGLRRAILMMPMRLGYGGEAAPEQRPAAILHVSLTPRASPLVRHGSPL